MRGDYIAFLDSDDCYAKSGLSDLYEAALKYDADLISGFTVMVPFDFKYKNADKKVIVTEKTRLFVSENLQDYVTTISWGDEYKWVWIWRQLYRRDLLEGKRFVDGLNIGDDICFMLDVLHSVKRFAQINTLVTYHRVTPGSLMQADYHPGKFSWFPAVLKYIKENAMNKYPKFFHDFFYCGFLGYFYHETVFLSKKHKKFKREAANTLRRAFAENNFPKKYYKLRFRVIIWFFIRAYAG